MPEYRFVGSTPLIVTLRFYRSSSCPQLPRITGREVVQALRSLGWEVVVQKGSHLQLKHSERGGRVTVAVHAGETIGPGLLRSILAQAQLTADEFRAAL